MELPTKVVRAYKAREPVEPRMELEDDEIRVVRYYVRGREIGHVRIFSAEEHHQWHEVMAKLMTDSTAEPE